MEDSLLWSVRSLHTPEQNLKAEWRLAREKVSRWAFQQGMKGRKLLACDGIVCPVPCVRAEVEDTDIEERRHLGLWC